MDDEHAEGNLPVLTAWDAGQALHRRPAEPQRDARRLSVILPTYNERRNIAVAVERIDRALSGTGVAYEIIVVDDDSPDHTWEEVESLARRRGDLHLIRRLGRRGLSSAVVEGFSAATGNVLAVMDADLQHDADLLPAMVSAAGAPGVDLVIATRYGQGGSAGDWTRGRLLLSRLATVLSWAVVRTRVSDPMSGYFLIASHAWRDVASRLNPRGFKILLEIIARSPPLVCREIGYTFQPRLHGASKLDGAVGISYLSSLVELSVDRFIDRRILCYGLVGAGGAGVNLATVRLLHDDMGVHVTAALAAAIGASMVSNFLLNNFITFSDRHRSGLPSLLRGLASFSAVSSIGAAINLVVANFAIRALDMNLYAGAVLGILVATVWNFRANRDITWRIAR